MGANEIISQVLTSTNQTYINGVSASRKFSEAVLNFIAQGLVEKNGKGVSDKFVTEQEANDYAQIFVNRVKPVPMKPRERGSYKNGGSFSNDQWFSETETVGIDILTVVDDPIYIPRVTQDNIRVDLLAEHIDNFTKRLALILNGASIGARLLAVYNDADAGDRNIVKITDSDVTNKLVIQRFEEANSLLDEGDEAHGIDVFPLESRIACFKMAYRPILKAGGLLVLGGANYGYEYAREGGINDAERTVEDGFWGYIDGVEVHGLSNLSLKQADGFLGFTEGDLKASNFVGYIASGLANARGCSNAELTKVVDAQAGQGVVLQPLAKLGAICWYPKGNCIITKGDYSPFDDLKTMFSGITGINYKLKGAGSRYYPAGSVSAISTTAFTCSADAKDDFNVDHAKGAYFFVDDAKVTTVAEYLATYGDATYKGTFTLGASKSTTIADTEWVNILVIADDGSCTIINKQYNA